MREQGIGHITPQKLHELFEFSRTEQNWVRFRRGLFNALDDGEVSIETFGPTALERLEKFKQWARRYLPAPALAIVVATIVTTVAITVRKGGKSATKAIAKSKNPVVKAVKNSPAAVLAPAVKKTMEVAQEGSGLLTNNLWVLVVIPVGLFLWNKYDHSCGGNGRTTP